MKVVYSDTGYNENDLFEMIKFICDGIADPDEVFEFVCDDDELVLTYDKYKDQQMSIAQRKKSIKRITGGRFLI